MAPQTVHLALIGEEVDISVRRRDEQILDEVLFPRIERGDATSSPPLRPVCVHGQALDVSGVGQGDDDVFFRDEIFVVDLALFGHDLGAPLVAEPLLDVEKLFFDHVCHLGRIFQQLLQIGDRLQKLGVLGFDLFPLQAGQPSKLHVEDRHGLPLRQSETVHQLRTGIRVAGRSADDRDDLVDVVGRDAVAFQDVGPLFGCAQVEPRAPGDDLALEVQIMHQHGLQVEQLRLAVYEGQHDNAERFLHLRVLEELIEHHVGISVAPQLDDDAHPFTVRLVAQGHDAVDAFFVVQLRDAFDERRLVDHVGNLGYDDALSAALNLLNMGLGAHDDPAPAGHVSFADAAAPYDQPGRWKVRTFYDPHELFDVGFRLVDQEH